MQPSTCSADCVPSSLYRRMMRRGVLGLTSQAKPSPERVRAKTPRCRRAPAPRSCIQAGERRLLLLSLCRCPIPPLPPSTRPEILPRLGASKTCNAKSLAAASMSSIVAVAVVQPLRRSLVNGRLNAAFTVPIV